MTLMLEALLFYRYLTIILRREPAGIVYGRVSLPAGLRVNAYTLFLLNIRNNCTRKNTHKNKSNKNTMEKTANQKKTT